MPEDPEQPQEQQIGSILGPFDERIISANDEGIGLQIPPPSRTLSHADPQWYELDLDQEIDDPDNEQPDPMPTKRYFTTP